MPDSELVGKLAGTPKENPRLAELLGFFPYVQRELSRIGVTRELLWREYKGKYPEGYEYSQFCEHYGRWLKLDPEVTAWIEHAAGDRMYVDFTGKKTGWWDRETGAFHEAELFIALLAASQYIYAEATASQRKDDWIVANRNALEAFGGVPAAIVPDCLKSAVTKGDKYEPDLNRDFEEFARHYGTVILPARPRHPRDKALVEGTVKILYTRIYAALRNRKFYSLAELNEAIRVEVAAHNRRRFQKMPHSRQDLYETVDKPALKPLPARRYEIRRSRTLKVQVNYHVEIREDGRYYSVPWRYAGKRVTVTCTERTVEIYHDNVRIAFHRRHPAGSPGRYVTQREHMPEHHRFYKDWSRERIESWAGRIGCHVRRLAMVIMERCEHPEQGFKSAIGVISLSKKYPAERVDTACRMTGNAGGYRTVKTILESGRDLAFLAAEKRQTALPFAHENLRGQAAYE